MPSIAFPYLRIRPDNIIADPWTLERRGRENFLTELLEDWDPTEALHLRRRVRLNFDLMAAALVLPAADLSIRASLIVGTGGPRGERRRIVREEHRLTRGTPEAEFFVVLEGEELSERLTLRSVLTLESATAGSPLSPREPGVELWQDLVRMALEPDEPRFAIQVESFAASFSDTPYALWRLAWNPGLMDRDMAGNVRLFVNSDRQDFVDRVSAGDPATMNLMAAGVMEQLISAVLTHDAMTDGDDPPTSIASTASGWISQAFPGRGANGVRELMKRDPAGFSAAIATVAAEFGLQDD